MKLSKFMCVVALSSISLPSFADDLQTSCYVSVSQGSNLNVRDKVEGKLLGKLRNGTKVNPDGGADVQDSKGQDWAFITWRGQPLNKPYQGSRNQGWASWEFIKCD